MNKRERTLAFERSRRAGKAAKVSVGVPGPVEPVVIRPQMVSPEQEALIGDLARVQGISYAEAREIVTVALSEAPAAIAMNRLIGSLDTQLLNQYNAVFDLRKPHPLNWKQEDRAPRSKVFHLIGAIQWENLQNKIQAMHQRVTQSLEAKPLDRQMPVEEEAVLGEMPVAPVGAIQVLENGSRMA